MKSSAKAVAFAITQNKDLSECSLDELRQFSDAINSDVFDVLTLDGSLAARNLEGGTAPAQVLKQVKACRALIQ